MKRSNLAHSGTLLKRIAALGLAIIVFACGMAGCAQNTPSEQQGTDEVIELKWQEAKDAEKDLIKDWYKRRIADADTLIYLFELEWDLIVPKPCCKVKADNHLPIYSIEHSLIDGIPQMIGSYFDELDNASAADLSIKTEEDIENKIIELREQFGITVKGKNVSFADIPLFENLSEEMKNKIYLIQSYDENGYGNLSLYINRSVCEKRDNYGYDYYSYICRLEDESVTRSIQYDDFYEGKINNSAELSYDVLSTIYGRMDAFSDFKRNDEPLEEVRVYADEIIENLVPIFEDDEAFKELCEKYNIEGALELLG